MRVFFALQGRESKVANGSRQEFGEYDADTAESEGKRSPAVEETTAGLEN